MFCDLQVEAKRDTIDKYIIDKEVVAYFDGELRSFGVVRRKHHERRVYGMKLKDEK